MDLCFKKILTVSQSNLIQYIPFFVISKAKSLCDSQVNSIKKEKYAELLFTTCFVSELIQKSFPARKNLSKIGGKGKQRQGLEDRMINLNILTSL